MIYNIKCLQDAFISNKSLSCNVGRNPILKVAKETDSSTGDTYLYRSLLRFDVNNFTGWISSGVIPWNTSSMDFRLKLYDVYFSGSYPDSFYIFAHPILESWSEGNGIEFDMSQSGSVNWGFRNSVDRWVRSGGSYDETLSSSQYFEFGNEDLDVDITNIFTEWLNCNMSNYGVALLLSSSQETSGSGADNYNHKLFYGRETVTNYEPIIEIRWDDCVKDDGSTFVSFNPLYSSYDNYFYLYNSIHNKMYDFPNISTASTTDMIFTIYNNSGTILTEKTASWKEKGIWEAGPITGNYTGDDVLFYTASWASSGALLRIDQIYSASLHDFDRTELYDTEYVVSITNLRSTYKLNERPTFQVFCRPKYPSYNFASGNQDLSPTIMRYMYYEIVDHQTNEKIIPYHNTYTRLSYDSGGNYFKIFCSALKRGRIYRIRFYTEIDNSFVCFDDSKWIFKIV